MLTSHFLKVFATFVAMIAIGLAGVYLVNTYGKTEAPQASTESGIEVSATLAE